MAATIEPNKSFNTFGGATPASTKSVGSSTGKGITGKSSSHSTGKQAGVISPSDISDMVSWHKADAGVTESAGELVSWADQSGNGNTITDPGLGAPDVVADGQNGLPRLDFNKAESDVMQKDTLVGSPFSQPFTICIALKNTEAPPTATGVSAGSASPVPELWGLRNEKNPNNKEMSLASGIVVVHGSTAGSTNNKIMVAVFNGTSTNVMLNGVAEITSPTTDIGADTLTDLRLGTNRVAGEPWSGSLYEVITYSKALNATEQTDITDYLNDKWALY